MKYEVKWNEFKQTNIYKIKYSKLIQIKLNLIILYKVD